MEKEPKIKNNHEFLERRDFINEVGKLIVDTFPFDESKKKKVFYEKIKLLAKDLPMSNDDVLRELKKILASLNNTHLFIEEKKETISFILDKHIFHKAGEFWVSENGQPVRVLNINGEPIMGVINKLLEMIGGGTIDWKINVALRKLMNSEKSGSISLLADDRGKQKTIEASFVPAKRPKEVERKSFVSSKILEGNLGYLKIKSWSNQVRLEDKNIADFVDEEMANLEGTSGLIVDVRDNSGGDSSLASRLARRFLNKTQVYTKAFVRKQNSDELEKREFEIEPLGPVINKPAVVLTGPKCLSSNELFILMLKDTGHAITVGETTGGGSGNPKSFNLTLGKKEYKMNVPTWKLVRNNGQEIENVGIEPDIEVKPTPEDIIENKDPVLERAINYLRKEN